MVGWRPFGAAEKAVWLPSALRGCRLAAVWPSTALYVGLAGQGTCPARGFLTRWLEVGGGGSGGGLVGGGEVGGQVGGRIVGGPYTCVPLPASIIFFYLPGFG